MFRFRTRRYRVFCEKDGETLLVSETMGDHGRVVCVGFSRSFPRDGSLTGFHWSESYARKIVSCLRDVPGVSNIRRELVSSESLYGSYCL